MTSDWIRRREVAVYSKITLQNFWFFFFFQLYFLYKVNKVENVRNRVNYMTNNQCSHRCIAFGHARNVWNPVRFQCDSKENLGPFRSSVKPNSTIPIVFHSFVVFRFCLLPCVAHTPCWFPFQSRRVSVCGEPRCLLDDHINFVINSAKTPN